VHALVESGQGGVLLKVLKTPELFWLEAFGSRAQQGEMAAVALDHWSDLAAEVHEGGEQHAHDMEAVCNDAGVGEPAPDHGAVRAGEIDADPPDALTALEGSQEAAQIGLAAMSR